MSERKRVKAHSMTHIEMEYDEVSVTTCEGCPYSYFDMETEPNRREHLACKLMKKREGKEGPSHYVSAFGTCKYAVNHFSKKTLEVEE